MMAPVIWVLRRQRHSSPKEVRLSRLTTGKLSVLQGTDTTTINQVERKVALEQDTLHQPQGFEITCSCMPLMCPPHTCEHPCTQHSSMEKCLEQMTVEFCIV